MIKEEIIKKIEIIKINSLYEKLSDIGIEGILIGHIVYNEKCKNYSVLDICHGLIFNLSECGYEELGDNESYVLEKKLDEI
jgi:hypothetical protein